MDINKLQDDLTILNVMALYDFMCPIDYSEPWTAEQINNRKSMAHKRYLNDPLFHQRVKMLVAYTVDIITNAKESGAEVDADHWRCKFCNEINLKTGDDCYHCHEPAPLN